ncbi:MAG: hypothetical protein KA327_06295 [Pseudarcicella sp.]|nr:hypothetical protein [Pseudarcicella sp.]
MSTKERLFLFATAGFLIIWVLDLQAGTPEVVKNDFWANIFYHYPWLMLSVGCMFCYQYYRQLRLKSEKNKVEQKELKKENNKKFKK